METKTPSPIEIQEGKVSAIVAEIQSLTETLKYERAKLEGMREMEEFNKSKFMQMELPVEPLRQLSHRRVRSPKPPVGDAWAVSLKPILEIAKSLQTNADDTKRRRQLSDRWQAFFHFIDSSNGATVEQLDEFAVEQMKADRKLVREQLKYYVKERFLRLDAPTLKFMITDLGRTVYDPAKGEALSAGNTEGFDSQSAPSSGDPS